MRKTILCSLLIILISCHHPGHDQINEANAILLSDELRASVSDIDSQLGELIAGDTSSIERTGNQYSVGGLLDEVINGDLQKIDSSRVNIRSLIQEARKINFFQKIALFTKATRALKRIKEKGINIREVFDQAKKFGIPDFSLLKTLNGVDWQSLISNLERARASDENSGVSRNLQSSITNRLLANWKWWLVLLIIILLFIIMLI